MTTLIEGFHVRLLDDWIKTPDPAFIHPHCTWKLADGHVCAGTHLGQDVFENYRRQFKRSYPEWHEVVSEVIGSPIGGIVIGNYQFRREKNGFWYSAPFTHVYRIQKGQIVSGYYYMGEVRRHLSRVEPTTYFFAYGGFPSLN
ncbi:hypothetical protein GCM10028773_01180 [Spirosoma koreense]